MSRVPSAERLRGNSRKHSRIELKNSKSQVRIQAVTQVGFHREPTVQSLAPLKLERVQTAKSNANEGEMRRTRVLMDKISGKHLLEQRAAYAVEEAAQSRIRKETIESEKVIRIVPQDEDEIISRPVKQLDRYIELILKNVAYID